MASGEIDVTPGRVLSTTERVDNAKLNDLGVPILRVKQAAITAREIADGSISSDKLDVAVESQLGVADGSVTTAKLVDKAVTAAKVGDDLMTARTTLVTAGNNDLLLWWDVTSSIYRKQTYAALLAQIVGSLPVSFTGTLTVDPASLASLSNREQLMTVTGVVTTNTPAVVLSCSIDTMSLGVQLINPRVSAANTVQFYYYNFTGGSVNLPSLTVRATVFQY